MSNEKIETVEVEQPAALESLSRAEIDIQIATARKYPRELSRVKAEMLSFATLDVETAESCFYSVPRAGKNIQGPSVRLAEIALSCYGHIRSGSRVLSVVADGEAPHVVVQAVCHDLQRNVFISVEKRRRITKKKSKDRPDEDDINLACNAGAAIALRDAVFKVVPFALVKPIFEQAKKVAIGDAKTLADRRVRMVEAFGKMGVDRGAILLKLGLRGIEDINLEHMETLIGMHAAIKDGELSVDDAFRVDGNNGKDGSDGKEPAPATAEPEKTPAPTGTPQQELAAWIEKEGFTFEHLQKFGLESGNIPGADSLPDCDAIKTEVAKRLLRSKEGLRLALTGIKARGA